MNSEYRKDILVALYYLDKTILGLKSFLNTRSDLNWDEFILGGVWGLGIYDQAEQTGDSDLEKVVNEATELIERIHEIDLEKYLLKLFEFRKILFSKLLQYPPQYSDIQHSENLLKYYKEISKETYHASIQQTLL